MSEDRRIAAVVSAAAHRLCGVSDSPRLDAELLLARAIDVPRSFLFAHPDDEIDAAAGARFSAALGRRLDGEPLAYLCGEKEFWSLRLMVTPATLVPRPETEILVAQALARIPRRHPARVLDLGTGSGAVALALARERPSCDVTATDVCEAALAVAIQNARQLDLPNVEFLYGDWTAPVRDRRFDVVVSNPPYVADGDAALAALRHEPRAALAAGPDGLDAFGRIAAEAGAVTVPGGALLLEHGAEQARAVGTLLERHGWRHRCCVPDDAGLPRVSIAERPLAGA